MDRFDKLIEDFALHAEHDFPNEACGVILDDYTYIRADNKSLNPKINFILDPGILAKYDNKIWGIFHSHPGEEQPLPSKEDKHAAAFSQYKFIVGFAKKYYIYWYDKNVEALKFSQFESKHLD
jgi:proteasome lid subunit RPN8/RPN11